MNNMRNTGMKKFFLVIMILAMAATKGSAQIVSVNTNALMDAALCPSFGFELVFNKRSSLAVDAFYGKKVFGKDIKIQGIQPEYKFYFSGRPMYHHYVGGVVALAKYNMHTVNRYYDGHAIGAGLSYGYVWPVTERLLLDFHTSLGLICRDDRYYGTKKAHDQAYNSAEKTGKLLETNNHDTFLAPIKIGVSVCYIIK